MSDQGPDAAGRARVEAPPPPELATAILGERTETVTRYVALLAGTGSTHGLIGPREVPRLWERHVLNCAVLGELLDDGVRVVDVGSGAGLPGLVLALIRPDLDVHLVDSLDRRTRWLADAVAELALDNVTVHRARAEEMRGRLSAPVVTARAVAALGTLSAWCLPLVDPGGRLLALKGRTAEDEVGRERDAVMRAGGRVRGVHRLGATLLGEPTTAVEVVHGGPGTPASRGRGRRGARRGRVS